MEGSLKEHCLDPRTFWFKLMTYKHHAPCLNMLTTTLYLTFVITVVCLCYKSLPTLETDWSRNNDMRINATKTKEMVICFCRNDNHVASIPRIVIDNNDIARVTQAKVGPTRRYIIF